MKFLIIYASRYGSTEKCAESLSEKLKGETNLINIQKQSNIDPSNYDTIILGGSIKMGQVLAALKNFALNNLSTLKQKKVALFLCCGFPENLNEHLKNNFPDELISKAICKECFGGELNTSKMTLGEKLITKMVTSKTKKEGKSMPHLLPENIDKMAEILNG